MLVLMTSTRDQLIIMYWDLIQKKRWYVSWHFVVVMSVISLEYCFRLLFFLFFPLCTYCVNSNVLIEGQDTLALWGQSQLYRHSRRLCNGRFDWDTVFPDEGTSFQNHVWQASRESFTESVLLFTRTGGTKQGAECVWLCYHWNEEWGGGYYVGLWNSNTCLLTANHC